MNRRKCFPNDCVAPGYGIMNKQDKKKRDFGGGNIHV